jgi:hypothetical protein
MDAKVSTAMSPERRRRISMLIVAAVIAVALAGVAFGYITRTSSICPDHKPPVAQQDYGMGYVLYRCADGLTVTNGS